MKLSDLPTAHIISNPDRKRKVFAVSALIGTCVTFACYTLTAFTVNKVVKEGKQRFDEAILQMQIDHDLE